MIPFKTVLAIFIIIIILDKGLTILNIIQANKNFPKAMEGDYFKVEQNPMAKWFFVKFGLWTGTWLFSIVTLLMMLGGYFILSWIFNQRIALWFIFIVYGFVLANNTYFLLKFARVIE